MNNEINKSQETDRINEILQESTEKAEQSIRSILDQFTVVDEISDIVDSAKLKADNRLDRVFTDINENDSRLAFVLKGVCKQIDNFISSEKPDDPKGKIIENYEQLDNLIHTQLRDEDPAAVTGAMTYALTNELMSTEVSLLVNSAAGKSRLDILNETMGIWTEGLIYNPEFKESLIERLGVPANHINEAVSELQETVVKAAEATGYIAASLGLSAASVFENAVKAVYAPVLLAEGNQEKLQEVLLNNKTDEFQAKLDQLWQETGFNETIPNAIKEYGEDAVVIGLSVLATTKLIKDCPPAAIAIAAVCLLDSLDKSFINSIEEHGELTFKDVLADCGTASAMYVATKVVPIVNKKLLEAAPALSQTVASMGVEKVSVVGRITGTLVKAAMGAADATIYQTAAETRNVLRYALNIDQDIDIKEELKKYGINIVSSSAISGAGYFLTDTIRNSEAFAKVVKLFTGHEYVAKYDDFAKIANKEIVTEPEGGSYGDVKKHNTKPGVEINHVPANSASEIRTNDGPAVKMEKHDHWNTASWGNSKEAKEYRQKQAELIKQGKLRDAIQMDIDDIRSKWGNKYDEAIKQMLAYVDEMMEKGGFGV